jgi:hypothetical protein
MRQNATVQALVNRSAQRRWRRKSTMTTSALITRVTRQDGAYLSRFFVVDLLLGNPAKAKAAWGGRRRPVARN